MNNAINELVRSIVKKNSLAECSVSELQRLTTQYPYFGPVQFLLARKLKVDAGFLDAAWDDYVFGLVLEQSLLISMEDQARWAVSNKITDRTAVPNYLGFIHQDALKMVKPDALGIIR